MDADGFFEYLTKRYRSRKTGRPLATRPARDAVSRCQRVESVIGTDLDRAIAQANVLAVLTRIESCERDFRFSGNARHGISQHRAAAKLYAAFSSGARHTVKIGHFYPGRRP